MTRNATGISLALAGILMLAVWPAAANGGNQVIFLTRLPEITSFGSAASSGIAVVDLHAGEVAVQVTNLTDLSDGFYAVWLTAPNLAAPVFVAPIPESGHLPTVIVELPAQTYRYVLITAEHGDPGKAPLEPGEDRALAGVFPNEAAVEVIPGVGASGQPVEPDPPLDTLPETGAVVPSKWLAAAILTLVAIVGAAGFHVGRQCPRGHQSGRTAEKGQVK